MRKLLGALAPVLIGGALAVGIGSLPASAAPVQPSVSYTDTGLQVNFLHTNCPAAPTAALTYTNTPAGEITVNAPTTGALSLNAGASTVPGVSGAVQTNGNLVVSGTLGDNTTTVSKIVVDNTFAPGCVVSNTLTPVTEVNGALAATALFGSPAGLTQLSQSDVHYVTGAVQVVATGGTPPTSYAFALGTPAGSINDSSNGLLTVSGSTAPPGTYTSNGVTATDSLGAATTGAFQLVVSANKVAPSGIIGPGAISSFSDHSGSCLTATGQAPYAPMQLFTCGFNGGWAQQYQLVPVAGQLHVYEIQLTENTTVCATLASLNNGATLVAGQCNLGAPGQKRQMVALIHGAGACHCGVYYKFTYTARVMDDFGFNTANGATVGAWNFNGGRNQAWGLP